MNTPVNTPQKAVHPGGTGVDTLPSRETSDLGSEKDRVHLFIPAGDEQMNTLSRREHADEHGVNAFGELPEVERLLAAAERAVLSPDALADEAEVMLRGEIP
jgi:hypothetical protein